MRILILLLLVLSINVLFAQSEYLYLSNENIYYLFGNNDLKYGKLIVSKGYKKVSIEEFNKKNKLKLKTMLTYNDSGKVEFVERVNKKNKRSTSKMEYKNNLLSKQVTNKGDGQKLKTYLYQRNQDNSITSIIIINGQTDTVSKTLYFYNEKNKLTASAFYKKGKLTKHYEYTYYEDGSKKESKYFKKDKLKYVWKYDCKPEGVKETKAKDTTIVCVKSDIDEYGNKKEVIQSFDNKGKPSKVVKVLNKDKKIIEYNVYDHKDKLTYQGLYKTINGNEISISKVYNKKGEIDSQTEVTRNSFGITTDFNPNYSLEHNNFINPK